MDSVRRIFFIFFALLVSFNLVSNPRQPFSPVANAAAFTPFEENGKVGLKNDQGQIVIPAQYESIGWSNGEFSLIGNVTGYRSKGSWGLINTQNNKVTKAEYEDLSPGAGEIIVARKKLPGTVIVRSGCINLSGKQVIPFLYDGIRIASFRAIVYTRTGNQFKHGLLDLENHTLIPLNFHRIYPLGSLRFAVENFDGKTAIFSEDGKQLSGFLIDSLSSFKKDYAIIYENQRQGLINRNGEIKVEPAFNELRLEDDGTILRRTPSQWVVLDGQNKSIRQTQADSIIVISKNVLKIRSAGRYQLTDESFSPVCPQSFSSIGPFRNGKANFIKGNRTGVVTSAGKVLIKAEYSSLSVDNRTIIAQSPADRRFVLLDSTGNLLSPRSYEQILPFNGNFYPVKNRGFWGAVNPTGKEIIACTHDSIGQTLQDLVVVKFKGKYGVINVREDWVVTPQAGKIQLVTSDRYLVQKEKTKFLKSIKGEIIYFSDNPLEMRDGYLIESLQSGSFLKIDMQGLTVERFDRPESIQEMYEESEGLRAIKKDNRYGFVDNRGRLRIANRYENVKSFSDGLAACMIRGKWGFINHADQIAIQPVYESVEQFSNGFAIVRQRDLYGLIDKNGKLVLPVRYDAIEVLKDKSIKVKQNGMWGLSANNGKILLHPKFETLTPLTNGYAIISQNSKFGVVTLEGMSTIPQVYDGIMYDAIHEVFMAVKKTEWEAVKFQ
ncbi:MAG TPA: WG repeat-containing protein [Chryseosolibacter sp.]